METIHSLQYLCEMALVHSDPFLRYLPSEVASSSVCLARHTLDQQPAWVGLTSPSIPHPLSLSLSLSCSPSLCRAVLATL